MATMNGSDSSSGSDGASPSIAVPSGTDAPLPSLKVVTSNADSCTWYANSECTKPRTCYDCLNVAIPSSEVRRQHSKALGV